MTPARAHTLAVLSAIRRPRRKRKVGRIPRPLQPTRIYEAYGKAIHDRVCAFARSCFDEHAGEILHLLATRRHAMGRTDADAGALAAASVEGRYAGALIDRAAREFSQRFHPSLLHAVVRQFGKRTDDHQRQQLDQQLRSAIGVPLSAIEKPHRDRLDEWAAKNVDLIVTVPDRYFDRLRGDVLDAFEHGTRPGDLADEFSDTYGIGEDDATRIAVDQTLKLAADLNHDRMQSLGVERAVWRSLNDERVCELCEAMEGVEFDLATGADGPCGQGTLPGDCHPCDRCYSEPILDGLIPQVDGT